MGGIASRGQLRWSFGRWAIVTVPLVVLIGFLSGGSVASTGDSGWYRGLAKPAMTPPNWLFPVAWATLYVLLGLAVAIILNARGARRRWPAVGMFVVEIAALAAWTPLFFGAHKVLPAFWLIVFLVVWGIATTVVFGRVRRAAAWLMVPFLIWVSFASLLNLGIHRLNPDAGTVAPGASATQML